jgi:hypothetical protein
MARWEEVEMVRWGKVEIARWEEEEMVRWGKVEMARWEEAVMGGREEAVTGCRGGRDGSISVQGKSTYLLRRSSLLILKNNYTGLLYK